MSSCSTTLVSGFRSAVLHGELVVGDTGDRELVSRLLREHRVDTVMHFAAHTIVPESVTNPLKYYGNNTCSTRSLLQCCQEAGVKHFVFSSTAAVYGIPAGGIAAEDSPTAADQSVRHVEADERVDAARPRRRDCTALRRAALLQRRRLRSRADASASRRSTARCSPRSRAKSRSASVRTSRSSAPTTRRRTAPACATTSTSRISPMRTSRRSTTCAAAVRRRR